MERIFRSLTRRDLLKFVLALPLVRFVEDLLAPFFGPARNSALAAAVPLKVAKLSQLERPWSTARFEYFMKVKAKSTAGDTVNEERLPGLVVRLPDEIAQKRGGGPKSKFQVVSLYCTHNRCKADFIADPGEIEAMIGTKPPGPVYYCGCHQTIFDIGQEAKPINGPAKEPLWKFEFDIRGDDLVITGIDPKAAIWNPGRAGGLGSEYPVREGERGL
jgi:Rieske Fe-S protein